MHFSNFWETWTIIRIILHIQRSNRPLKGEESENTVKIPYISRKEPCAFYKRGLTCKWYAPSAYARALYACHTSNKPSSIAIPFSHHLHGVYAYTHVHVYICIHICIHSMYIYAYICIYIYKHVCIYVRTHLMIRQCLHEKIRHE